MTRHYLVGPATKGRFTKKLPTTRLNRDAIPYTPPIRAANSHLDIHATFTTLSMKVVSLHASRYQVGSISTSLVLSLHFIFILFYLFKSLLQPFSAFQRPFSCRYNPWVAEHLINDTNLHSSHSAFHGLRWHPQLLSALYHPSHCPNK